MKRTFGMLALGGVMLAAACGNAASTRHEVGVRKTGAQVGAVADDPLTRPIAPERATRWLGRQDPLRVHGNTWLVGFAGLTVGLIQTGDGLILIDGGVPQGVAQVEANLAAAGFPIQDVKYILSTEPHWDHSGGLAALARDSGATVVASPAAAEVLRRGRSGPDDPQAAWLDPFPAVERVQVVRDGETLTLGGVTVTAVATPGHTPGSMSWTWRSCDAAGDCRAVMFAASLNPLAADGYAYSDPAHRTLLDGFRQTFATMRAAPCDILLSSHPEPSGQDRRLQAFRRQAQPNPFIDPSACRAYADRHEALLERRLAEEAAD